MFPYTTKIPSGSIGNPVLTQPTHVIIKWPNTSGNLTPVKKPVSNFFKSIFG